MNTTDLLKIIFGDSVFGIPTTKVAESFKSRIFSLQSKLTSSTLLLQLCHDSLLISEARTRSSSLSMSKIQRIELTDNQLDHGIPVDPDDLGKPLSDLFSRLLIPSSQILLSVPNDCLITTIIELPSQLDEIEIEDYLEDDHSPIQLPVPIKNLDYDLTPIPQPESIRKGSKAYLFTGIPKVLLDRCLGTFSIAGRTVVHVEPHFQSAARLLKPTTTSLQSNEWVILLDLNNIRTEMYILAKEGATDLSSLPAIRAFPSILAAEQNSNYESLNPINPQQSLQSHSDYIPLQALDLTTISEEILKILGRHSRIYPSSIWHSVHLTGINSCHPNIANLLESILSIPTFIVQPRYINSVEHISLSEPLYDQELSTLTGLAFSFSERLLDIPDDIQETSPGPKNRLVSFRDEPLDPSDLNSLPQVSLSEAIANSDYLPLPETQVTSKPVINSELAPTHVTEAAANNLPQDKELNIANDQNLDTRSLFNGSSDEKVLPYKSLAPSSSSATEHIDLDVIDSEPVDPPISTITSSAIDFSLQSDTEKTSSTEPAPPQSSKSSSSNLNLLDTSNDSGLGLELNNLIASEPSQVDSSLSSEYLSSFPNLSLSENKSNQFKESQELVRPPDNPSTAKSDGLYPAFDEPLFSFSSEPSEHSSQPTQLPLGETSITIDESQSSDSADFSHTEKNTVEPILPDGPDVYDDESNWPSIK